mmetsp:Transcript_2302/g.5936  ORF Transcript_2302/g.5936 Transcript_2302/m.5936 type:complete len:460 (+) Transcript_2302:15-1394(+)
MAGLISPLCARTRAPALNAGGWVRALAHCPFAYSPAAMQLAQLPEFATAREHAAHGELGLAMPLIARTVEVCHSMRVLPMELLALEAKASVQADLGSLAAALRTRELQRELVKAAASSGTVSPEEGLLVTQGLLLTKLRGGDAEGSRALAEEGIALAGTQEGRAAFALHATAAASLDVNDEETCAWLAARVGQCAQFRAQCAKLLLASSCLLHQPGGPGAGSESPGVESGNPKGLSDSSKPPRSSTGAEAALVILGPLLQSPVKPGSCTGEPAGVEVNADMRGWASMLAGRAHLALGSIEKAEAAFSDSLSAFQKEHGDASRLVAIAVLELGLLYAEKLEPIMAEGLLRSATDKLLAKVSGSEESSTGYPPSAPSQTLGGARALHRALHEYAKLLDGLETNNRKRTSEAAQLRAQASALASSFDGLHAHGPDEGARGAAGCHAALLDWYVESTAYEWFR